MNRDGCLEWQVGKASLLNRLRGFGGWFGVFGGVVMAAATLSSWSRSRKARSRSLRDDNKMGGAGGGADLFGVDADNFAELRNSG